MQLGRITRSSPTGFIFTPLGLAAVFWDFPSEGVTGYLARFDKGCGSNGATKTN